MPAKLPINQEGKRSFSISIEETWKTRFLIACSVLSSKINDKDLVASRLVREFIIKKTIEFEKKLGELNHAKK